MIPKDAGDLRAKTIESASLYKERDDLILLCREMYRMKRERTSNYLGEKAFSWRTKIPPTYWQSSSKAHNSVDVAVAVLAGHAPQFRVTSPEGEYGKLTSRAEKFLLGLWLANCKRQEVDLGRRAAKNIIRDGGVGFRTIWDHRAPEPVISSSSPPPGEGDGKWVIATYPRNRLPITIEVIPLDKLRPMGDPTFDSPFSEILHVQRRTVESVLTAWDDVEGISLGPLREVPKDNQGTQLGDYVEWWGYEGSEVHYMIAFDDLVLRACKEIEYPRIPIVLAKFKEGEEDDPGFSTVPFLYPSLWALDKQEYLSARTFRLIDMYAGLPPVHRGGGGKPLNISGEWGQVLNLDDKDEKIEFPSWPGQAPDVWKTKEDVEKEISQGTFSDAMYGVSSRVSGYAMSQLIGADTLRMDTPKSYLELALGKVGDLVLMFLEEFSPHAHIAVASKTGGTSLSAMLAGDEAKALSVEVYVKPKQSADEVRLAMLGSQLASLPKPPISWKRILEQFFGVAQPEEEMEAVLGEEALKDPIVRLLAMLQALTEEGSPYAPIVEAQLAKVLGQIGQGGPEAQPGMGMGAPQTLEGTTPVSNAPTEENLMGSEAALFGGPREPGGE